MNLSVLHFKVYFWHILPTVFVWINKYFVLLTFKVYPVIILYFENLSEM